MQAAVIGAGTMGAAMARTLAAEGHEVRLWNRTHDRARAAAGDRITAVESVADAVRGADVVLTVLFDLDAVLSVADELVGALDDDAVWVQSSTVGPDGMARVAQAAGTAVDRLVDAPVLGTKQPAENGQLVVLASGPEPARRRAQPAFDAVGVRTLSVGDRLGAASALKLVCNAWVALVNAGVAQSMAFAESLDIDPQLFLDAIAGGPLDLPYAHLKGALIQARGWDEPAFALDGVRKDVGLMIEAADASGMPADLLTELLAVYDRAAERGHGGHDMAAVRAAFDA